MTKQLSHIIFLFGYFCSLINLINGATITFGETDCSSGYPFFCVSFDTTIGTPQQTMPLAFSLNMVPDNTRYFYQGNVVINQNCKRNEEDYSLSCQQASYQMEKYPFYQPEKSTTYKSLDEEFNILNIYAYSDQPKYYIEGEVSQDYLYIPKIQKPIEFTFLSASACNGYMGNFTNGVIDLSRVNSEINIFSAGYKQGVLEQPYFSFMVQNVNTIQLIYDSLPETFNGINYQKTKDSSNWYLRYSGLYFEGEDLSYLQFAKSVLINMSSSFYNGLPDPLVAYIQKKYPSKIVSEGYYQYTLAQCSECLCLLDKSFFPSIEIYTEENKFELDLSYFTYKNSDNFCVISTSSATSPLNLNIGFIRKYPVAFNPIGGSIAFIAPKLSHDIGYSSTVTIFSLSLVELVIICTFFFYYERNYTSTKEEYYFYKKLNAK